MSYAAFNKSELSLSEIATRLGKHKDFFVHVKRNTPKLYRLMSIYGKGNLYAGAILYFEAVERIRADLASMHYELSSCKSITRFFRETKEANPYKNSESLRSTIETSAFTLTDRAMRFHAYTSSRKLLRLYSEWKELGYTEYEKNTIKEMYV